MEVVNLVFSKKKKRVQQKKKKNVLDANLQQHVACTISSIVIQLEFLKEKIYIQTYYPVIKVSLQNRFYPHLEMTIVVWLMCIAMHQIIL